MFLVRTDKPVPRPVPARHENRSARSLSKAAQPGPDPRAATRNPEGVSMASMGRTHLLTGEDAEIRSRQDGAQPACNDSARIGNRAVIHAGGRSATGKNLSERVYR